MELLLNSSDVSGLQSQLLRIKSDDLRHKSASPDRHRPRQTTSLLISCVTWARSRGECRSDGDNRGRELSRSLGRPTGFPKHLASQYVDEEVACFLTEGRRGNERGMESVSQTESPISQSKPTLSLSLSLPPLTQSISSASRTYTQASSAFVPINCCTEKNGLRAWPLRVFCKGCTLSLSS